MTSYSLSWYGWSRAVQVCHRNLCRTSTLLTSFTVCMGVHRWDELNITKDVYGRLWTRVGQPSFTKRPQFSLSPLTQTHRKWSTTSPESDLFSFAISRSGSPLVVVLMCGGAWDCGMYSFYSATTCALSLSHPQACRGGVENIVSSFCHHLEDESVLE